MTQKLGHPGDGFGLGHHPELLLAGEHEPEIARHPAGREGCGLLFESIEIVAAIANVLAKNLDQIRAAVSPVRTSGPTSSIVSRGRGAAAFSLFKRLDAAISAMSRASTIERPLLPIGCG